MALEQIESAIVKHNQEITVATPKAKDQKKILDEDQYTQNVQKIIQRDFFPDLENLKDQSEYFEAIDKNDLVKLREIQIRFANRRPTTGRSTATLYTPSTFETPEPSDKPPSPSQNEQEPATTSDNTQNGSTETNLEETQEKKKMGLDKYLSKYTSEDNASFNEILKESERKHRDKHAWLYEAEHNLTQAQNERLALPDIEEQAAIEGKPAAPDLWEYKTKNALMYVPDGVEKSQKELVEEKKLKPREIIHENTRFKYDPHNSTKSQQSIQQAAVDKANTYKGKIGHDGKEIVVDTPKVNGYGFVGTPSPAPGVNESPLMTWGEIEGTPMRMDGSATPLQGPTFKIPEVPARDRIAMELAEKASKTHRAKKEEALKHATKNLTSAPLKFGQSNTDKLNSLSPAAQRLATAKLGIRTNTDKALRESYTPSPSHRHSGSSTPGLLTPGSVRTPGSSRSSTPGSARSGKRDSDITSLTDNLLNLPKRQKASDFFS